MVDNARAPANGAEPDEFADVVAGARQTVLDKLLGRGGPRYQLWPERMARGAISAPARAMGGQFPAVRTGQSGGTDYTGARPGGILNTLSGRPDDDETIHPGGSDAEIQGALDMLGMTMMGGAPSAARTVRGMIPERPVRPPPPQGILEWALSPAEQQYFLKVLTDRYLAQDFLNEVPSLGVDGNTLRFNQNEAPFLLNWIRSELEMPFAERGRLPPSFFQQSFPERIANWPRGIEPEMNPRPGHTDMEPTGQAVWKSKDFDFPVDVMKEAPIRGNDGQLYQRVRYQDQQTWVPANELTHTMRQRPAEPPAKEPEDFTLGAAGGRGFPSHDRWKLQLMGDQNRERPSVSLPKVPSAERPLDPAVYESPVVPFKERFKWAPEHSQRLEEAVKEGKSQHEIAREFGTDVAGINRRMKAAGLESNFPAQGTGKLDWTPEMLAKLHDLRGKKTSVDQIAKELGVSRMSAYRQMRNEGLVPSSAGKPVQFASGGVEFDERQMIDWDKVDQGAIPDLPYEKMRKSTNIEDRRDPHDVGRVGEAFSDLPKFTRVEDAFTDLEADQWVRTTLKPKTHAGN